MAGLYFAYGLNMDPAGMARRCPGAVPRGRAVLEGYRFRITRLGVATAVPHAGSRVHGLLWTLTGPDERALDAFELVAARQYRKARLSVLLAGGQRRRCLVYLASDPTPGVPAPGYLEAVLAAARCHGLPGGYLLEVANWRKNRGRRPRRLPPGNSNEEGVGRWKKPFNAWNGPCSAWRPSAPWHRRP